MKILAALVLLFVCCGAQAAPPSVTCTPHRTSGYAPLSVHLDCTSTTGGTNPFHNLLYQHTFGDTSAGTWAYGSNTASSKNFATGPIAAHVFDCAVGTCNYPINTLVCNSADECARASNTITVTSADAQWTTTKTKCLSTASDFTSCPSGATQVSNVTELGTTVAANIGTGDVRILLHCGETFTVTLTTTINQSTGYFGKYGTCANPIITTAADISIITFAGSGKSDWRLVDLDLRNTNAAGGGRGFDFTKRLDNVTILRASMTDLGRGVFADAPLMGDYAYGLFLQDSTFSRTIFGSGGPDLNPNASAQTGFYGEIQQFAFMGNSFDGGGWGEHVWRFAQAVKGVISHNTLAHPAPTKEVVTIRALAHVTSAQDSRYVVFSDNKLTGGIYDDGVHTNPWTMSIVPASASSEERMIDLIIERNWFVFAGGDAVGTQIGLHAVPYQYLMVRNNLFQMTGGKAHTGFEVTDYGLIPAPDSVWVYNNTFHSSDVDNDFVMASFTVAVSNAIAKNNLGYAPNDSLHRGIGCGVSGDLTPCTGLTASNNSLTDTVGGNGVQVNPSFAGTSVPKDFRTGTGTYPANTGTAVYPASNDDFLHCDDITANEHTGAFVPRVRARCTSAARQ